MILRIAAVTTRAGDDANVSVAKMNGVIAQFVRYAHAEPGGAQLQALARAVDRWLRSRLAGRGNPEVLREAEARLVAELVALLQGYD